MGGGECFSKPPAFILIPKCLKKVQEEQVQATLIAPEWRRPWLPLLQSMTIDRIRLGSPHKTFTAHHPEAEKTLSANPKWTFLPGELVVDPIKFFKQGMEERRKETHCEVVVLDKVCRRKPNRFAALSVFRSNNLLPSTPL